MHEHGKVLNDLHRWLRAEFSARGRFLLDEESGTIVGLPADTIAPLLTLTEEDDAILVHLGLGLVLAIPIDDPFEFEDIAVPLRALVEKGLLVSVPREAFGSPILRYTLHYDGGILSTKVPGREYVDIPIPGWNVSD
ncbi:hypothetical protein ACWDSJ_21715 [Nocardia sp. NPDC003482]